MGRGRREMRQRETKGDRTRMRPRTTRWEERVNEQEGNATGGPGTRKGTEGDRH